jgi:rubrerythrin
MAELKGIQRLDALIDRLIDTDQAGQEIEPMEVAHQLGEIRSELMAMPTVHRSEDDQRHYRCEACGTITHGDASPARCARCGKNRFVNVDID